MPFRALLLAASLFSTPASAVDFKNYDPRHPDPANPNCQTKTGSKDWIPWAKPEVVQAWEPGEFSDPAKHDPAQFQYIVTAIHGLGSHSHTAAETLDYLNASANVRISATVINQRERSTFAKTGFILRVPTASIVAVNAQDMVSWNFNDREIACNFGFNLTPKQILAQMEKIYAQGLVSNEVFVNANSQRPLKVTGVFVVDNPPSDPDFVEHPDADMKEILDLAAKRKLPVIHLSPQPTPKTTEPNDQDPEPAEDTSVPAQ